MAIDWDQLLKLEPQNLTEDEKDDLAENLFWARPQFEDSKENILHLFNIVQELARHKVTQVEELLVALDEAAAREARSPSDHQVEELLAAVQDKEKELAIEKSENERLTAQLLRIEREKTELSRELAVLQDEGAERPERSFTDSPVQERIDALIGSLKLKNSHIMQLLEDIEVLENENGKLKEDLKEKTGQSVKFKDFEEELEHQIKILKASLNESELKRNELLSVNEALESQIQELIVLKEKHDRELDAFADTLNGRIEEWKHLIEIRDEELALAREEIAKLRSLTQGTLETPSDDIKTLQLKIQEQEEEIERLRSEKINKTPEKIVFSEDSQELKRCRSLISELETKLSFAEEDALLKSKEVTTLMIQVQAYEQGILGLPEAVQKIKYLDKMLQEKENKILELVDACNHLAIEKEQCEEEILFLKEKLGWSPMREVDNETLETRRKNRTLMLSSLKKEVEEQKEVILDLKLKNRSLQRLDHCKTEEGQDQESRDDDLVAENDALRKGLHEILESIQVETLGEIRAVSLEKLLRALDARHVSGWYHPAMRLQAELGAYRATANELRNQIRSMKEELSLKSMELSSLKNLNRELEMELKESKNAETISVTSNRADETPSQILKEKFESEQRCIALETQIRQLRAQMEKSNFIRESRNEKEEEEDQQQHQETLSEERLKKLKDTADFLRSALLEKEDLFLQDIMKLQKEKSDLIAKIHSYELQSFNFEPRQNLEALQIQLTEMGSKYQQSLFQYLIEGREKAGRSRVLEEENKNILKELQATKERLYEAEANLKVHETSLVSSDSFAQEISRMARNLSEAESEIISLKSTIKVLENTTETEEIISLSGAQCQLNEKLQMVLNQLEAKLVESKTVVEMSTEATELKFEKLQLEKKNVEDLLDITQEQLKSLRSWLKTREDVFLSSEITVEELKTQKCALEMKLNRLTLDNLKLEERANGFWTELRKNRKSYVKHVHVLYELLVSIQNAFNNKAQFVTIDRAHKIYADIQVRCEKLKEQENLIEEKVKDLSLKEGELEKQLEAVNDLRKSFRGDSDHLVILHNNTTQLRLSEMKARKQLEFLNRQLARREEELKKLEGEILVMEEISIKREEEYKDHLKQWQRMQLELCEWLEKPEVSVLPVTNLDDREKVEIESEKSETSEESSKSSSKPEEMNLGLILERLHQEQRNQSLEVEVAALKTTVGSLQTILNQKESTIERYQELIKSCQAEHAEELKKLHSDLQTTRLALAQQMKSRHDEKPFIGGEKYISELLEYEEELKAVKVTLHDAELEAKKWKQIAEETEVEYKEVRARLEDELDQCKKELQSLQLNTQQTTETTLLNKIEELQKKIKLVESGKAVTKPRKTVDPDVEGLQKELVKSKEECSRLREQLTKLRSARQDRAKESANQDKLLEKLKSLEEMLKLSKAHQQELEEKGLQRLRSAEGVARWDERKRLQQTIDKLQAKIKEKEVALVLANGKVETFRNLAARWEQEKMQFEERLRKANRESHVLSKMEEEKILLSSQIHALQQEIESFKRAQQNEMERIDSGADIENLKRRNHHLQNEILSLKIQIDKLRSENQSLKERQKQTGNISHRGFQGRRSPSPQDKFSFARKLQEELRHLKSQHATTLDRTALLDAELQQARHQMSLWEEKNLADVIARREQELLINQLQQECERLRAQLDHKVQLLDRVKVLLKKAANKEKDLNEKVNALQNMVYKS